MTELFLYHNGRRGEVMLCRALYRAALATGFDLTLAVCRGDAVLLQDLAGARCRVVESAYANTVHGAPLDLVALAPASVPAIEVWLGGNDGTPKYQWPDVVDAFHADLRRHGIHRTVADPAGPVPMLDFAGDVPVPVLQRPAVWLDGERTRDDACHFTFDHERLLRVLPDCDLLCTGPVATSSPRVVDVSRLSWPVRSRLSESCVALVGTTFDPFVVTLTEANRWKPKAQCGYDARTQAPFWDYPGNPTELLATMDDLVDFLVANVVQGAHR